MKLSYCRTSSFGFSLIELLISSLLSVILLCAFTHLYLINFKIAHETCMSIMRENELRFLQISLQKLIHHAGFLGWCGGNDGFKKNSLLVTVDYFPQSLIAYSKHDVAKFPFLARQGLAHVKSDILLLENLSVDAKMVSANETAAINFAAENPTELRLWADCDQAILFKDLPHLLSVLHNPHLPAWIGAFEQKALYLDEVKETGSTASPSGIFLKSLVPDRPAEALLVGVKTFEMLFAERQTSNVVWHKAEAIFDWRAVKAVKFILTFPDILDEALEQRVEYIFAKRN